MGDNSGLKIGVLSQILKDDVFFKTAVPKIPHKFFIDEPELQLIYEAALAFFTKYGGSRPRRHEMSEILNGILDEAGISNSGHREAAHAFLEAIYEFDDYTPEHVKSHLYEVILSHEMGKAIEAAKELVEKRQFDEALQIVAKARSTVNEEGIPLDYIETYEDRILERATRNRLRYPTISAGLDNILGGGIVKGQSALMVASTGGGKTALLCRVAMNNLVWGSNVLFITLELSPWEISDRIDAAITGIPINDLTAQSEMFRNRFKKFVEKYKSNLGQLMVEEFVPRKLTVRGLEGFIERLKVEENFYPDVVIVDYADRMSWGKEKDRPYWLAVEHMMDELKGLAMAHNCILWTASQANRSASGKEEIGTSDVASSYAKTFPFDLVVSASQTPQEQKHNLLRLYVAKSRLGGAGKSAFLKTDFACMRVEDMSESEYRRACGKYGIKIPKLVAEAMSEEEGEEEDSVATAWA